MRRNNIRKTEALIMAFALSASLLLTSCGNQNTNGDSVNENKIVQQTKLELITIIR